MHLLRYEFQSYKVYRERSAVQLPDMGFDAENSRSKERVMIVKADPLQGEVQKGIPNCKKVNIEHP
jgi:hypothetical protein